MEPTILVGLDGATFDVIDPLAAAGRLPTLARLMADGNHRVLVSSTPPVTPAAWTSLYTGFPPAVHGVVDFTVPEPGTYRRRPASARTRRRPAFWEAMDRAGRRTAVLGFPVTYPPDRLENGIMLTGLMTPDGARDFVHPPAWLDRIERHLGGPYRLYGREVFTGANEAAVYRDNLAMLRQKVEAARFVLGAAAWDLLAVHLFEVDRVCHDLWHLSDPAHPRHRPPDGPYTVEAFYEEADRALADLLAAAPAGANVVVVSDHGFGPAHRCFLFNEWLARRGYLRFRSGLRTGLRRALHAAGATPLAAYRAAERLGLAGRRLGLDVGRREALVRSLFLSFDDVDWEGTRAFAFGNVFGQVRLNVLGREPRGCVRAGAAYERLRREIVEALLAELPSRVLYREEMEGDADSIPDLMVIPDDPATLAVGAADFLHDEIRINALETGDHRMNGIWIAAGPDHPAARERRAPMRIEEVAPALLAHAGLAPSPGPGGSPTDPGWTEEEERRLRRRMRDLGYLGA